jgi:HAD superfamily hydrolase (TIGR01509 family)
MTAPKAIVFDLGKVLVDFDYGIAVRRIHRRSQIGYDEVRELINVGPLLFRYETGLLSTEQFFQEVRLAANFDGSLAEFGEMFGNIFSPIQPMIDLHAQFRAAGHPTYIFSNTNELAIRDIRNRFPFFQTFTGHILSYEHRSMKPDPQLYEVVEGVSGRRGGEILYMDDRPENIEAGLSRGWQSILHEQPEKTRSAIEQLGILQK